MIAKRRIRGRGHRRLAASFEQAAVGIVHLAPAGRVLGANPCCCALLGAAPGSLAGHPLEDLLVPEDRAAWRGNLGAVVAGVGERPVIELRIPRRDGENRWVRLTLSLVKGAPAELAWVLGFVDDCTARREAEERLHLLESAVVHAPDAVAITRVDPRASKDSPIVFVNAAFTRMTGYAAEEILGRSSSILDGPETEPAATAATYQALQRGESAHSELLTYREDGTTYWADYIVVPVPDDAGRVTHWISFERDITERRRTEEALRTSEQRFRTLIEKSFDGVVLLDAEGRARYASPSLQRILGFGESELLGTGPLDIVHPDDLPAALDRLGSLLQRPGEDARFLYRLRHKDGSFRWIEAVASNLLADPGVRAVVLNLRDITEQRQAEVARERLAAIVASSEDAIIGHGLDGRIESWNAGAARLYGYTPAEVVGAHLGMLAPPGRGEAVAPLLDRTEAVAHYDTVHVGKDGACIDVSCSRSPMRDSAGQIIGAATIVREIGDRVRAQREAERARAVAEELALLRQQQAEEAEAMASVGNALSTVLEPEALYRAILEQAARVLPCDLANVLLYRDGWLTIVASWGEPAPAIGTRVAQLDGTAPGWQPASDAPTYLADTAQEPAWRDVPPNVGEHQVRSLIVVPLVVDGVRVGAFDVCSATPHFYTEQHVRLANAFAERVVHALRNARLYAAEQERTRAAKALAQLRSDFLASVSHELRTPLTAIIGFAELLQGRWDQLSEGRRLERIDQIVQAANRQQRLVEDLLLIGRIESASLAVRSEALALLPLLQQAVAEVQAGYPGQAVALLGAADVRVRADAARAVQVAVNLLDNAAKYSPDGSTITVGWASEGAMVALRVADRGPGVPAEGRDQLFARFGRLPGSRIRAGRVGTGLGLHISRGLAEAMGGDLDLEATGPEGSTFRLRLPLAPAPSGAGAT